MFQMIVAWKYSEYLNRCGGERPAATTTSAESKEEVDRIVARESGVHADDSRQPGGNEGPSVQP